VTITIQERRFQFLRTLIDRRLATLERRWASPDLTDACRYVLNGGGKRIRGGIVLLACEAAGRPARRALDAAVAVEVMHNFTLVHDDIMDHARTRRGRPSVHARWNVNTALLVGDVLLGQSYESLLRSPPSPRITALLTRALLEVCEGQALDLEFETRDDVTSREYFRMIEKKTARLISLSAELGAVIGGGSLRTIAALRSYGLHLGRAFQIQDDLLDVVADERRFGKVIGGDILERKKTFLLLTALQRMRDTDRRALMRLLSAPRRRGADGRRIVRAVTALYTRYGVLDAARQRIRRESRRAAAALDELQDGRATGMLRWLAGVLVHRVT
jgi:geranylgeranyl diphosphate synthase, type II